MLDNHINKKDILYSQDALLTENLVSNKIFYSIANKTAKAISKYGTANLLMNQIRVSEKNFPYIKKTINEFATKINIKTPITYIMQSDQINAFTYGTQNDAWVVITTRLIDTFNEQELKFVIGHELGHISAGHCLINTMATLLFEGGLLTSNIVSRYFLPLKAFLKIFSLALMKWQKASEYTCDRFGFLCCSQENVAYKSLIKLNLGLVHDVDIDIEDYLSQYDDIKQDWLFRTNEKIDQINNTHPTVFKRILALRMFALNYSSKQLNRQELDNKISSVLSSKLSSNTCTIDENFEELLLKCLIFLAGEGSSLHVKEKKFIDGQMNDYPLSSSLKLNLKDYLMKGISLSDIHMNCELNEEQKKVILNTICDIAVADGEYTIEEDTKFIDIAKKLKLNMREINYMRATLLKKYASADTIFSIISKTNGESLV